VAAALDLPAAAWLFLLALPTAFHSGTIVEPSSLSSSASLVDYLRSLRLLLAHRRIRAPAAKWTQVCQNGRELQVYNSNLFSARGSCSGGDPTRAISSLADRRTWARPKHETAVYLSRRAAGETGYEVSAGDRRYARVRFASSSRPIDGTSPSGEGLPAHVCREIQLTVAIPPATPEHPIPSAGRLQSSVLYRIEPGEPLITLVSERLMVRRRVASFWDRIAVLIGRRPVQALPTGQTEAILPPIPAVKAPVTA
jgi:hypothetical protein